MINKAKQFNIVITGTGGQGLITLLQILAEAALLESYNVKTSELHGLSQRGGSVEVHIRFGKKIWSPLIARGKADLILALETQEALRGVCFSNSKTIFLINKFFIPIPGEKIPEIQETSKIIKKFSKNIIIIPASEICQKELGSDVVAGIYLLGLAASKKLIPLKANSLILAIKKIVPEKFLELNLKTLNLAKSK